MLCIGADPGSGDSQAIGSGDSQANGSGDPQASGSGDPRAISVNDSRTNGSGDPPANGSGDPQADGSGDPPANGSGDPQADGSVDHQAIELVAMGGDGLNNGLTEDSVTCIITDETSSDWARSRFSYTLPFSSDVSALYSGVAKQSGECHMTP